MGSIVVLLFATVNLVVTSMEAGVELTFCTIGSSVVVEVDVLIVGLVDLGILVVSPVFRVNVPFLPGMITFFTSVFISVFVIAFDSISSGLTVVNPTVTVAGGAEGLLWKAERTQESPNADE